MSDLEARFEAAAQDAQKLPRRPDNDPLRKSFAPSFSKLLQFFLVLALTASLAAGCGGTPAVPTEEPVSELVLYDWEADIPQTVMDAFTAKYNIPVRLVTYESQEDALENIKAGEVYDVLVLESQLIPNAIRENLLAEIDHSQIPNFKNISANFRNLNYDPENKYSIPYSWGTVGLVYRADLVSAPPTSWNDLWDPAYQGKVVGWKIPRTMIGIALKSLGHSVNTERPAELEAALGKLIELKPGLILLGDEASSADLLASGEAVIAVGWTYDVFEGQELDPNIQYALPDEGTILWGDSYVIPANSPHKQAAEMFINFLLEPEISAQITEETYYWVPNDPAQELLAPEIRDNPLIFPPSDALSSAEIFLPLSKEAESMYAEFWEIFLDAGE